jgi:hypothetical protein
MSCKNIVALTIDKESGDRLVKRLVASSIKSDARYRDTLRKFESDDDWSFVIKSQAVIEAAVTELLVDAIGDSRLHKIFERLPLADQQIGKIQVAKELGLLNERQRGFVRILAALRNDLAHRIENVEFSLEKHVNGLSESDRNRWQKEMTWFLDGEFIESIFGSEIASEFRNKEVWRAMCVKNPKFVLNFSVTFFTSHCSNVLAAIKLKRGVERIALIEAGADLE